MTGAGRYNPNALSWFDVVMVIARHGGEATGPQLEIESGWGAFTVRRIVTHMIDARILERWPESGSHATGGFRVYRYRLGPGLLPLLPLLADMERALASDAVKVT